MNPLKLTNPWVCFAGMTISASVAYICHRLLTEERINEDKEIRTTRQSTIKVKVPKDSIGTVIGRGGENIKRIQNETRCRCHFEDFPDEEGNRNVVIRGTPENILEGKRAIEDIISNGSISVEIQIPVDSVGFVIGRNGETIRSLCEISGAKIIISRSSSKNRAFQSVTIKGSFEQIETAKTLINEKIAESEERTRDRKFYGMNTSFSDADM
ncbi:uncharacterized protein B4U80_06827 [Leptotrombidium deliense]|uniref:K Homology domain-containing protein n=1 Tax=Leptotrombidium deliense TaxID=299467 RepID=A0A443SMG4_9ACAR|nr:uncharacterized protein B4U80_06827 [Leptotrombidium deliense]